LVSGKDEDFEELWEPDASAIGFAAFVILLLNDSSGVLGSIVVDEA
jgi:hypothetical protein